MSPPHLENVSGDPDVPREDLIRSSAVAVEGSTGGALPNNELSGSAFRTWPVVKYSWCFQILELGMPLCNCSVIDLGRWAK